MEFLQQLVNGISLGSVYALIALGYTMVYGIVKLINFAHGEVMMVGAFTGYFVMSAMGPSYISLIVALGASMLVCAILGMTIEKTCYKPLRKAPKINILITAIGVSIFLQNIARVIPVIGPNPKEFPTLPNKIINILGIRISEVQLIVIITSIIIMIILSVIVYGTKTGKAMRATSYDRDVALLMGININRIISITFAIGASIGGVAGVLFAVSYPQVEPYMGIMPGLKAFVAAVFGGIGSIPGAMLGGYIMGTAETLTKGFVSSKLGDAVAFGILIIILIIRPAGILGKKTNEKV